MAQVFGQLGYEAHQRISGVLKAQLIFWQVIFKPRHYFPALVHNVTVQGQEPAVGKQEYVMFLLLPRPLSHEGQVTKMFGFFFFSFSMCQCKVGQLQPERLAVA